MRRFLGLSLAGVLVFAMTSFAQAQIGITIGNPYTGGISIGTPGYTGTGSYVSSYGANSYGGYGSTGYGYANGVSGRSTTVYGAPGYSYSYPAPATTYYGSGYRGYTPSATSPYGYGYQGTYGNRYSSYTYPSYSYPGYGYRTYSVPTYGSYGSILRVR
jgi:hypothetical protein